MIDITLQNFENDLLQDSMQQPILLDIWAPWCGPCKSLGPMLEKLEVAYEGRFKLAKLNSDDQPEIAGQLSQAFGVRSIPFCVMFNQGQPVQGKIQAILPLPESLAVLRELTSPLAAAWVAHEYLRGIVFSGWSWNTIGSALHAKLVVIQIAVLHAACRAWGAPSARRGCPPTCDRNADTPAGAGRRN